MKKRNLFVFSGLAFGLVFSMLGFSKIGSNAQAVKAEDEVYSGKIFIQKNVEDNNNDMKYTGSKLVGYFFDDSEPKNSAWGDAVWNTGKTYQEYTWSLNFEPTKFIMLRVDGDKWSSDNGWNNIWCRTGDVSLTNADVLWMYGNANEGGGWGTYSMETFVMDNNNVQLGELTDKKIKSNGEGLETFGKINFNANEIFYIKKTVDGDNKYNQYSCLDAISANLRYGGNNNGYIEVLEAATYELYFDFNGNTLYLTDPVIAEADEWSQTFLGTECSDSKTNWGTLATSYSGLSPEAKALFLGEDHVANDAVIDGYTKQAVQRYDYVLERYHINSANTDELGYEDFMGRATKINLSPRMNPISIFAEGESSNTIVAALIIVSLLATGGALLFLRKRKSNYLGR